MPVIQDKEVDAKYRLSYLKKIDEALRTNSKVSQVMLNFTKKKQLIEVYNSEGLFATEERPYIRLFHFVLLWNCYGSLRIIVCLPIRSQVHSSTFQLRRLLNE